MALNLRNLSVLAYANGFTLWHYKAGAEPHDKVCAPGFFADAADLLTPGDQMILSGAIWSGQACIFGSGNRIVAQLLMGVRDPATVQRPRDLVHSDISAAVSAALPAVQ
jgi:hypothetical protein